MKLSFKIILITVFTLILMLFGSGVTFYTVIYNIITTQETKHLLNSANDFVYNLESKIEECDSTFHQYIRNQKKTDGEGNLDFVMDMGSQRVNRPHLLMVKSSISIPIGNYSLQDFLATNPYLLVRVFKKENGEEFLYGFILQKDFFLQIAEKLRTNVAVYVDNELIVITNDIVNQGHHFFLENAYRTLSFRNNFDIYSGTSSDLYLIATLYRVKEVISDNRKLNIIIFGSTAEVENLRETTRNILLLLFIVSVILTSILTYLFSTGFRKQLENLNSAVEIVKRGDFSTRIPVAANDELGALASAFNAMLNELETQEKLKTGYTDLIALINRNESYQSLLPALLEKIVRSTNSTFGALYLVTSDGIFPAATFGFEPEDKGNSIRTDTLAKVVESKEIVHYKFEKDAPEILAGVVTIKVAEMILLPIFGNDRALAIIQLGSINPVSDMIKNYLEKIQGQLSIGLEKALAHKKLEQLVSELEVQKQKAEESTELKSKFLAMVSHELRTPLNSIMGLTELMTNDKSNSTKTHERLSVITKSSKRLLRMINEVLNLSRIEAGKMDVHLKEFSLYEFLQEVNATFQTLAEKKNLQFTVRNTLHFSPILFTDKEKLFHIIGNLVGNAVKFTSEGAITVEFKIDEEQFPVFSVLDTGIGMQEKELHSIFDEFHQVDNSSTRSFGGSGLGLSIAKRFVELIGGKIGVESTFGKGSVFTVQLPVNAIRNINEVNSKKATTESLESTFTISENTGIEELKLSFNKERGEKQNVKVLIVDDDPDSLFTMSEIMKECGFTIAMAKNGLECIEVLEQYLPDIILLDIMMPKMDGFQTIKKIRQNDLWTKIPVIAVTAKAMAEDRHIVFKNGFNGLVPKPINAGVLAFNVMKLALNKSENDV